jgi:hypothetical protein
MKNFAEVPHLGHSFLFRKERYRVPETFYICLKCNFVFMGFTFNELEIEDLLCRAKPHLNKMYPLKELVNGKNIPIEYEFVDANYKPVIVESQRNSPDKPRKFTAFAVLKSPKGEVKTVALLKVVEYFEQLAEAD